MTDIIGTLYDMEGVNSSGGEGNISKIDNILRIQLQWVYQSIKYIQKVIIIIYNTIARATRIFSELDINGDGELTCDEFIRGCMQVKIVNTHIVSTFSYQQYFSLAFHSKVIIYLLFRTRILSECWVLEGYIRMKQKLTTIASRWNQRALI